MAHVKRIAWLVLLSVGFDGMVTRSEHPEDFGFWLGVLSFIAFMFGLTEYLRSTLSGPSDAP